RLTTRAAPAGPEVDDRHVPQDLRNLDVALVEVDEPVKRRLIVVLVLLRIRPRRARDRGATDEGARPCDDEPTTRELHPPLRARSAASSFSWIPPKPPLLMHNNTEPFGASFAVNRTTSSMDAHAVAAPRPAAAARV